MRRILEVATRERSDPTGDRKMALDPVRLVAMAQKDKRRRLFDARRNAGNRSSHVALHTSKPGGPTRLWGCQSRRPPAYSPETACPSPCHRRAITRSIFYQGSEQRPFLLPPCFHGVPGVEAAPRRTGQNRRADNELAGAPVRIKLRTPMLLRFRYNLA